MITFDYSPTVYWLIGYILAGAVVISAFYKPLSYKISLVAGIALLVLMRLPVIVFNRELNPDESQMLSHAITLFQDPVYWRSVDGTTIGPLDIYWLVIPRLLGFEINYTSGRIMGLISSAGALLFLFFALKNWFGERAARHIWLVPVILLSFTQEVDFVHYSSEQVPVLLLAICVWLLSRISVNNEHFKWNAYWLGFVAGAIPFAKLQAVPQAIVLVLGGFFYCYQSKTRKDYIPAISLALGGLTFPFIALIWMLAFGVFRDMIDFYLLGNAVYAGGEGFLGIPAQFLAIFKLSADFQAFTYILVLPILLGLIQIFRPADKKSSDLISRFTILFSVLASIYAVTKSGNDFIHYLNFCIIPWTLLAAFGIKKIEKWAILVPAALLIWFAGVDGVSYVKERRLNNFDSVNARTLAQSPVVQELMKYRKDKDYMVVWGWQCTYYVEAQLAEGTAENHTERSIFDLPVREIYRKRFMSDLARNKPAFILDAVGKNSFWVQDKKTQGIGSYPALNTYILNNYKYIGDFDGTDLYVRSDRAALR
ncbi:hypothetical protein DYBT9623_04906 [Dyadobacter sp. CECT 9623]|uniref:Glycosyltransferase RgtA/B/C/D-like domain-containing protein n=1 Tax=Dyadobacter linearis TaxID=2823330 RepID=A0ABN7RG26_9BACT|nr:hypothetical protein [Dyadobacter sp. CECT 9623]CAG5073756.1 hypothetical protein DYBT9623_04906 [Dyadobacter sp. CECT 9623]